MQYFAPLDHFRNVEPPVTHFDSADVAVRTLEAPRQLSLCYSRVFADCRQHSHDPTVTGCPELFRQVAVSPKVSQRTLPQSPSGLISGTRPILPHAADAAERNSVLKNKRAFTAATICSILLAGCGGGSTSGGSDPTSNPPPTYSLGGSITGLTASGLVLANGTATVSPVAGASTFSFPAALASGTSYDVVVQTQPTGEVCTVTSGSGTIGSASATAVSITCQPQEFAYAAGSGIYGYSVNFTDGALTGMSGNPLENVATSGNLLVDPSGHFLFAIENGNIAVYGINGSTGALTAVTGSPFSAGGQADFVALDPTGHFLYASAVDSQVFAYTVDSTTGALTAVAGSPYAAGQGPRGVAVDSTGKFVYVVNNGTVSAYGINQTSGALTPVTGSPFPAGSVAGLTAAGTQGGDCFISADPHSNFIYVYNVTDSGATISPYEIDTSSGALSSVSGGASYTGGSFCGTLAIDSSGMFLYSTDPNNNQLWYFKANLSTGALAAGTGAPATTPNGSMVDPSGQFLYVAASNSLIGFTIDASTGEIPIAPGASASAPGTYAVAVAEPKP